MAVVIRSRASSLDLRLGANPPSSPTAVLYPLALRTAFRLWKTSAVIRRPSRKVSAPTGMIMNSWMSTLLSACWPPLMILAIGTGMSRAITPPIYR